MRHEIGKVGYLEGTIVSYKGLPVYIQDAMQDGFVATYLNNQREKFLIKRDDKDLNVSSLPLGYINTHRAGALYLMRTPERQWKQGISNATLKYMDQKSKIVGGFPILDFREEAFAMFVGNYTHIEDAIEHATALNKPWAFHRHFAVDRDNQLFFKTKKVGTINKRKVISLEKTYSYLHEMCNEVILNVA